MLKKVIFSAIILFGAVFAHAQKWEDLNKQVLTYLSNGDYNNALTIAKQARTLAQEEFGENHADYSASLHNLASSHKKLGQFQNAESLYWEALKIDRQVLGVNHQNYALSLFGLANLYKLKKDYTKSEALYLDALNIMKKSVSEQHPDYALILSDYGDLFTERGNYKKAESTLRRAREITRSVVGESHPDYATVLFYYGKLYKEQTTLSKADDMLNKALGIFRKTVGTSHPDYVDCKRYLDNLYNPGFQLYEQDAMEIPPIVVEEPPIEVQKIEEMTSKPVDEIVKTEEKPMESKPSEEESKEPIDFIKAATEPVGEQAAQPEETQPDPVPPPKKTWRDFSNLMDEYAQAGDYNEAIGVGEKALSMAEEEHGKESSICEELGMRLAMNYKNAGVYGKAIPYYEKDLAQLEQDLGTESLAYKARMKDLVELYNATGQSDKADALARKNLYSPFESNKMTENIDENKVKMMEDQVADFYQKSDKSEPNVGNDLQNFNLFLKGKAVDSSLGIDSKTEGSVADLHGKLKEKMRINEAVIDFMKMENKETGASDYFALVTRFRGEETKVIALGSEASIKNILDIKANTPDSYTQNVDRNNELYNLIWKPLEGELKGINFISISPVGVLNRVAFGGLIDGDKNVLADKFDFHYYSSLRDYLKEKEMPALNKSVAFFGGAMFGEESASNGLAYMPATKDEVKTFQTICNAKGWDVETFIEGNASEPNAKTKAGEAAPGILHLATPAFYKPMAVHSGVALSNSNVALASGNFSEMSDDGLLTAKEIAQMDLSKTNLVLLSASETDSDLAGYDGIIGIQRAFKKAGVRAVIFSQWKVPDKQTQELLTLFYFNHLSGMSIHKSLASAQNEIRKLYNLPYYWAGFILIE